MKTVSLNSITVIGIKVRTTNENGQAEKDITTLWDKWLNEKIVTQIPDKVSEAVYSIYTNYEKDHTKPYDVILACEVSSTMKVPEGMVSHTIEGGNFKKFIAQGALDDGIVIKEWIKIWNSPLDRAYTSDFEVYGEKAQDPKNAEVPIYIRVN